MVQTFVYCILLVAVLIYPPATLSLECYKSCMRRNKLTLSETIICWIPLYNLAVIRKAFYGTSKLHNTVIGSMLAFILFRTIAILILYENVIIMLISSILMLATIGLVWLLSAITFVDTAVCVRESFLVKVLCIITPPLGAYLVSRKVRPYMKTIKDELEGTFKG